MPSESRSPDGKYELVISEWEARMSLWIFSPALRSVTTGETLFQPRDSSWSADSSTWEQDEIVTLKMRKYPGDHQPSSLTVRIDCEARTAEISGRDPVPLRKLEAELDRCLKRR